jgi:hypothetical protein
MDIGQFKQPLSAILEILTTLDSCSYSIEVDDEHCLSEFLMYSLSIKSERGSDDSDIRALHQFHRRKELGSSLPVRYVYSRDTNVLRLNDRQDLDMAQIKCVKT